jgi:hypothetical protein
MATEAARLNRKKLSEGGKRKTVLTHTGLLMEGLERIMAHAVGQNRRRAQNSLIQTTNLVIST